MKLLPINLAPLQEQHRIIAKIEALFSELDKGIESFKTAREQLKIYRQALLKHAFSGKLTEQWRAENSGKLESAEALLQHIQTERQQRYQQQLKDWEQSKSPPAPLLQRGEQAVSQSVSADTNPASPVAKAYSVDANASATAPPFEKGGLGGISKPKPPKTLPPLMAEELAELPELPEGWMWEKVGNICNSIVPNRDKPKTFTGNFEWITTPCLSSKSIKIDYSQTNQGLSEGEVETTEFNRLRRQDTQK